jgi:hypothetical protein
MTGGGGAGCDGRCVSERHGDPSSDALSMRPASRQEKR